MTSTSSEPVVLRGEQVEDLTDGIATTDLRAGTWTRLGAGAVVGDPVTEATLSGLARRALRAARAQGYAAGWAEGRRRATETAAVREAERDRTRDEEHAHALAALRDGTAALAAALDQARADLAATQRELADRAVELGLQVAEAVLQRELAVVVDPGAEAVARALAEVPATVPVTVRLHPADLAVLDPAALDGRQAALVGDPALQRGDAVVETETHVVDATVAAAMARVREVLGR